MKSDSGNTVVFYWMILFFCRHLAIPRLINRLARGEGYSTERKKKAILLHTNKCSVCMKYNIPLANKLHFLLPCPPPPPGRGDSRNPFSLVDALRPPLLKRGARAHDWIIRTIRLSSYTAVVAPISNWMGKKSYPHSRLRRRHLTFLSAEQERLQVRPFLFSPTHFCFWVNGVGESFEERPDGHRSGAAAVFSSSRSH